NTPPDRAPTATLPTASPPVPPPLAVDTSELEGFHSPDHSLDRRRRYRDIVREAIHPPDRATVGIHVESITREDFAAVTVVVQNRRSGKMATTVDQSHSAG